MRKNYSFSANMLPLPRIHSKMIHKNTLADSGSTLFSRHSGKATTVAGFCFACAGWLAETRRTSDGRRWPS